MKNTKTLTGQLKKTIFLLGIAMISMWIFFYACIRKVLTDYTLENMERMAGQGIVQVNTSFLEMEQLYLAMMQEAAVITLFEQEDNLDFHRAAAAAEDRLQELARGKNFLSSIILCQTDGFFYRLHGTISNTGVERLLYLVQKQEEDYICARLDNENYIGYIARLDNGTGSVVMLMKEAEIERMLESSGRGSMQFVLAAGDRIVASSEKISGEKSLADLKAAADHTKTEQVGYTPFQLWVFYAADDTQISMLFLIAMALMAFILAYIMRIFLQFWQKNFFSPIQSVISEVETYGGVKGKMLPLTGQEHIDGLIHGINDMATRIETRDKALIISLKKQINAHFIFNVINIIKALSEKGESEKAGEMCNGLSLLLRYANEGESYIDGMEEFFMLENYVDIMKIRYPNRFEAEIDMEDYLEEIRLPRMLLQPLVENSIVHGFIGGGKNGTVHVYAVQEAEKICFIVEDDGCGISQEALDELREELTEVSFSEPEIEGLSHVALLNIERRIQSYFGAAYGLTVFSEEGKGTKVVVTLPYGK